MTKAVLEIEAKIKKLSTDEFSELNKWLSEFENSIWDEKILKNNDNSNLANLAKNALNDFKSGNLKQL